MQVWVQYYGRQQTITWKLPILLLWVYWELKNLLSSEPHNINPECSVAVTEIFDVLEMFVKIYKKEYFFLRPW